MDALDAADQMVPLRVLGEVAHSYGTTSNASSRRARLTPQA